MTEGKGARAGPLIFSRYQLLLGIAAVIVLAINCGLLIWGRYVGKDWYDMWPTGVAALAMVLLLVSIIRRAPGDDRDGDLRRS